MAIHTRNAIGVYTWNRHLDACEHNIDKAIERTDISRKAWKIDDEMTARLIFPVLLPKPGLIGHMEAALRNRYQNAGWEDFQATRVETKVDDVPDITYKITLVATLAALHYPWT